MAELNNVTFACEEPVKLADFWAGVPIHLDVHTEDGHAQVERLVGLGATVVEERSQKIGPYEENSTHAGTGLILSPPTPKVMKDPEGNGFCVS